MASQEATAVTTQPRSKRKEIEQFVRDLDPTQVVGMFVEPVARATKHEYNLDERCNLYRWRYRQSYFAGASVFAVSS